MATNTTAESWKSDFSSRNTRLRQHDMEMLAYVKKFDKGKKTVLLSSQHKIWGRIRKSRSKRKEQEQIDKLKDKLGI